MDKEYLHKVLDKIVYETKIDRDEKTIFFPFSFTHFSLHYSSSPILSSLLYPFSSHCRDVYGLNKQEIEYVWNRYKMKIYNKIKNG